MDSTAPDHTRTTQRVVARHGGFRKVNISFFDGHAGTFDHASLPNPDNRSSSPGTTIDSVTPPVQFPIALKP